MVNKTIFKRFSNEQYSRAEDTTICLDLLEEIAQENKTDLSHIYSQRIYPMGNVNLSMHTEKNPLHFVEHVFVKKDYSLRVEESQKNIQCIGKLFRKVWMDDERSEVFVEYRAESNQPDFYI